MCVCVDGGILRRGASHYFSDDSVRLGGIFSALIYFFPLLSLLALEAFRVIPIIYSLMVPIKVNNSSFVH